MNGTTAQAEQAANQARAAAAAYESAFAATVPPPVIAANRARLAALIATNVLGQNTPAIAATEADYAEMWAQDAAAMYGYADSSAIAAQMAPFRPPPQTTNPAGTAAQAGAVTEAAGTAGGASVNTTLSQLVSLMPNALQTLASPASSSTSSTSGLQSSLSSLATLVTNATGPYSPFALTDVAGAPYLFGMQSVLLPQNGQGVAALLSGPASKPITGALAPLADEVGLHAGVPARAGIAGGAGSGAMGRAGLLGALSVPNSWASAAPAIRTAAAVMPSTGVGAAPAVAADGPTGLFSDMVMSSLAGRAIGGTAAPSITGTATRVLGGAAAEVAPTTATIIVIPAGEE
ncbi:PPE domain-containing protein [uncultured Mycobacterium sp.]|uniref:PPE family protein, SVP subgroup n=1 Tax=uncultured Mycobacterium sp. TaxID=171292 RepID=UPI0035C9DCFB